MIVIAAACCLALSGAAVADSYKLDAAGKCRDDKGKFAKQTMCTSASPAHTYKADSKGKCRDEKSHFAEAKLCHA
jgi:hypothetical protein